MSSAPQPKDPLEDTANQVHLFREVADARIEGATKRAEQISSRAALLITAAALTSALGNPLSDNGWAVLAIVATLAAAALGVVAVFPTRVEYPNLDELRTRFLGASGVQAELHHADEQVTTYNNHVKKLSWRGWVVQGGFLLLGASILFRTLLVLGIPIHAGP